MHNFNDIKKVRHVILIYLGKDLNSAIRTYGINMYVSLRKDQTSIRSQSSGTAFGISIRDGKNTRSVRSGTSSRRHVTQESSKEPTF